MDGPNTEVTEPCIHCQGRGYIEYSRGHIRCLECGGSGMLPLEKTKREKRIRLVIVVTALIIGIAFFIVTWTGDFESVIYLMAFLVLSGGAILAFFKKYLDFR